MGRDIGFLPGDKDEKLAMWMQPIFDNIAFLLSTRGSHLNQAESRTTEPWRELAPADRAGVVRVDRVAISRDGSAYAYSTLRIVSSDLYVLDSVR